MKIAKFALPAVAFVLGVSALVIIFGRAKPSVAVEPSTKPSSPGQLASAPSGLVAGAGIVEPSSELVGIGTTASGVVQQVFVTTGQEIKKDSPLFVLDDREAQADIASKNAGVAVAKSKVENSIIDEKEKLNSLMRYKSIGDKRAMSEDELSRREFAAETAKVGVVSAKANLAQAEALLNQARIAQNVRTVRAPFDSTVLQVKIRAGEFAQATQLTEPLVTLGRTDPLHVRVDIDEADVNRVLLKGSAEVSPRGSPELRQSAEFVRIEPLVIPKKSLTNSAIEKVDTRVQQLVYALPSGAAGFFVGQQVDAYIPAKETSPK